VTTRLTFKVRTICIPCPWRSLTRGYWRLRTAVRPSVMPQCLQCRLFNGGRAYVHNEVQSGHQSVITDHFKDSIDYHVRENSQFTIDELHEVFSCVLRSVCPLWDWHSSTLIQKHLCLTATDEEVKETVADSLNGPVVDFCEERIIKLVWHLDKCQNHNGDCIEK
jgi:hypothetical protein